VTRNRDSQQAGAKIMGKRKKAAGKTGKKHGSNKGRSSKAKAKLKKQS
jgi:hypothetical protein